jgi:transposase
MSTAFLGLDLAKSVFQVHGVDVYGMVVVAMRLRRDAVLAFSVALAGQPCRPLRAVLRDETGREE